MKKFKNYILMLLVPIILLGCVQKGVSEAIEEDTTLGGYTWSELQTMIDGSQLSVSGLQYNRAELLDFANEVATFNDNAYKNSIILYNYLNNSIYTPIYNNSTSFVYSTALTNSTNYDSTVRGNLGIYSYDQLVVIYNAFKALNKTDTLAINLLKSLTTTINAIDTRKAINPFYATVPLLYSEYKNFIGNSTYTTYLNSIDFDVATLLTRSTGIETSLSLLTTEINTINSSTLSFNERTTLLSYLNQLKTAYTNYVNGTGTINDVESKRALVYAYENAIITDGAYLEFYYDKIDEVYSALKGITNPGTNSDTILSLIAHIDAYKALNGQFTNKNYLKIHSQVANVLKEYQYLVDRKATLEITLGLIDLNLGDVSF